MILIKPIQAVGCSDPYAAIRSRAKRDNVFSGKPAFHSKGLEFSIMNSQEPFPSPNPEITGGILQDALYVIAFDFRSIPAVKDSEFESVISNGALKSSKPQVPVRGLNESLHTALGQPLFNRPVF